MVYGTLRQRVELRGRYRCCTSVVVYIVPASVINTICHLRVKNILFDPESLVLYNQKEILYVYDTAL